MIVSSCTELEKSFLGDIVQIRMYAMKKRKRKISCGASPQDINVFVATKVVPHILMVSRDRVCPVNVLFLLRNLITSFRGVLDDSFELIAVSWSYRCSAESVL